MYLKLYKNNFLMCDVKSVFNYFLDFKLNIWILLFLLLELCVFDFYVKG